MFYDITHALTDLTPGAIWVHRGDPLDIKGLEWLDPVIDKPNVVEIFDWINLKNSEEPMRLLRIERDKRLAATDWWALPDRTMTPEQVAYRQALRDLPSTADPKLLPNGNLDMNSVNWPIMP
jgi:hypothetical protein